ncbi:MAG: chromosome partition protein MukB [Endozoicomonas sp.]
MSQPRTQIRSLSLVNFRGIFFKTLSLHHLMSNLIGHNGAGKTTIMGALLINRVPDNRLVRLRNNSDSGQDRSDNGIWGRIEQGVCYSLVDYQLHDGSRVIAGVQLKRLGKPRVELKLFAIKGIDNDVAVRDLVMHSLGDGRYEPLEGNALKNQVAMMGGTLERFKSLGLFMDWQFDCRIIPRRMENSQDRQRYYRMLETSLYGGLSSELQKGLRDYLLPTDDKVRTSVGSMQNALRETRKTRDSIEATRAKRQFVKSVLQSSYGLGEKVIAWADKRNAQLQQKLFDQHQQEIRLSHDIDALKQQISTLELELKQLDATRQSLEEREDQARTTLRDAEELTRLKNEHEQAVNDVTNINQRLDRLRRDLQLVESQREKQAEEVRQLDEDCNILVKQLASAEAAYSEEARKAGLYQEARRSLNEARETLDDPELNENNLQPRLEELSQQRNQILDDYHHQEPLLQQMEKIREHFNTVLPILTELDTQSVSAHEAASRCDFWLLSWREKQQLAASKSIIEQQLSTLKQKQKRRNQLLSELKAQPSRWQTTLTDEENWQKTLDSAVEEKLQVTESLESLKSQLDDLQVRNVSTRNKLDQARQEHKEWLNQEQLAADVRQRAPELSLATPDDLAPARLGLNDQQMQINRREITLDEELRAVRDRLKGLEQAESEEDRQLQRLAELTGGSVVSRYFDEDDISLEEAAWLEAKMGPLRHAILVRDTERAAEIIRSEASRPEHVWLLAGNPGDSFSEDEFLNTPFDQPEDGSVLVRLSDRIARVSREPEFPTIGRLAREKEQKRLEESEEQLLDERQSLAVSRKTLQQVNELIDRLASVSRWIGAEEPPVDSLQEAIIDIERRSSELHTQRLQKETLLSEVRTVVDFLERNLPSAVLLTEDTLPDEIEILTSQLESASSAASWLQDYHDKLEQLEQRRLYLNNPPVEDIEQLKQHLDNLKATASKLGRQKGLLEDSREKLPYLRYKESVARRDESSDLRNRIKQEWEEKDSRKRVQQRELDLLDEQQQGLAKSIHGDEQELHRREGEILLKEQEMRNIDLEWQPTLAEACQSALQEILHQKREHGTKLKSSVETLSTQKGERDKLENSQQTLLADLQSLAPRAEQARLEWLKVEQQAQDSVLMSRLQKHELKELDNDKLRDDIADGRANLVKALESEPDSNLLEQVRETKTQDLPGLFDAVVAAQQFLTERMDKTIAHSDDPLQALNQLEEHLTRLEAVLEDAESQFLAESDRMGQNIERKINQERKQILQLNSALSKVHFGTIRAIRVELEVIESFEKVLNALQSRFYGDLFKQSDLSVEEALAEIFKKETGGTIVGEKLLDYREYIRLKVLVQRAGHSNFEPANPTNLSTGEAIGTGLAVLTMVLHSWEVATDKRHGKGHSANRLLFLDEAARLDARALATLEELCENQNLQLLVGAPDNVLPKNGVTYRMVRLMEPHEHVIFSAVRGRSPQAVAV